MYSIPGSADSGISDRRFRPWTDAGARLEQCWIGSVGIDRCAADGTRLTWTIPTLAGGNTTAGPFGVTVDVSALSAGRFEMNASVDHLAVKIIATRQEVWLTK